MHVNAFPAVHLKKLDSLDLFLKFSSELLMVGLTVLVGAFTIGFFKFGGAPVSGDNSYAFMFLSNHTHLDNKYYAQQTSISTIVTGGGLIARAQADDFQGLTSQPQTAVSDNSNNSIIDNNSLSQPSPDSIKALVAKQIKVYTTMPGDSLASVAVANGISVQTLADANHLLNNANLKPGWYLIILPTDGELYTATSNDTLPDVAKKFSGNLDTIMSYNGLDSAEDITAGQLIIIPGGHLPTPPKPKVPTPPKPKADTSKVGGSGTVQNVDPEYIGDDSHAFPKGYCTWYVAQKVRVSWGGNANSWISNAKAYGAVVDRDPAHGTILVTNESRKYGHVAYVESVTDHNSVIVSEMNYDHFGKVDTREISLDSSVIKGFIHP